MRWEKECPLRAQLPVSASVVGRKKLPFVTAYNPKQTVEEGGRALAVARRNSWRDMLNQPLAVSIGPKRNLGKRAPLNYGHKNIVQRVARANGDQKVRSGCDTTRTFSGGDRYLGFNPCCEGESIAQCNARIQVSDDYPLLGR
jgi:hypothetical protein